jgi:RND family efflux transporter, MFP subunit
MKKKTIMVVSIVAVLLGIMAWTLASNKKAIDASKEMKTTETDIAVTVVPAEMKETDADLQLVATTEASKDVDIASECSGKIIRVHFRMGDYVAKGKVLAQIDDTYKRLAYQNARLDYTKCQEDYERYQVLHKGEAVSDTQLRDALLAYENASIQLQNARKQWDDTKITAPFSGYITSQKTEVGAFVNPGTVIAGIADISRLKVVLEVSESNAYQLHQGQPVSITSDIAPDKKYDGTISQVSQKAGLAHTYPVEIQIANNGKEKLKAGTYVNVTVNMSKNGTALMIPRDAIVSSVKAPSVYVVKGKVALLVKITTGRSIGKNLEVVSGLAPGDMVVTNGQINLTNGAKVSAIKES